MKKRPLEPLIGTTLKGSLCWRREISTRIEGRKGERGERKRRRGLIKYLFLMMKIVTGRTERKKVKLFLWKT